VVSVWLAIDGATLDNGCMHLLDGGHRAGFGRSRQFPGSLPANRVTTSADPRPSGSVSL
jgi:ectoine hydroxylase-related dioxygenase (phytanoyl-CoA dioxygenase family)